MKKLFCVVIFLLFAFPVFAEETGVFLSNQSSVQITQFATTDEIYIEGFCLPANQDIVKIYITPDKIWQANDKLSDISAGIETLTGSADGRIPRTKIWNRPLQGIYDVVIDTNNDSTLQEYEKQCITGITGVGFTVGNPAPPPTAPPAETPSSPPPASTPPPAPAPVSTKPSVVFSLDEYVTVKNFANIRKSAGGKIIGTQDQGALGAIIGGPVQAPIDGINYWFWNVNFENDPDGWVASSMLKSAPAPAKEIITEPSVNMTIIVATTTATTTATEEPPQEQTADINTETAQVSGTGGIGSSLKPFMGYIIIGIALFLGLIFASAIIAWALQKNRN